MSPDLVVVGNLLVDDIVLADGRTHMGLAGGAALYLSLAARLWGVSVGVSSVAGSDYPAAALEALAERGIDLAGVRRLDRPGVRTWLLYEPRGRRVVHRLGSASHAEVSPLPEALPRAWSRARAFHLSPMPLASQRTLVEHLATLEPRPAIALDPHEPLRPESLAAWSGTLARVDTLFLGEDEIDLGPNESEVASTLRHAGGGRPARIVFKRGAGGGAIDDAETGRHLTWPGAPDPVFEPTGAGDAFAGGLLAGLLAAAPLEAALDRAVVSAGLALEAPGAAALLAATPESAARRLAALRGRSAVRA